MKKLWISLLVLVLSVSVFSAPVEEQAPLVSSRVETDEQGIPMGENTVANETRVSPQASHYKAPNNIGYRFLQFVGADKSLTYPIRRMHVLHSDLYPFGGANTPFGLGLEGSFLDSQQGFSSGPLGLSARLRVWSKKDFDIGIWGAAALNTLSAEELKNSPYGRDVFTVGVSLKKVLNQGYVENYLSVSAPGQSTQKIGKVSYDYKYGFVIDAKIRGGVRFSKFDVGAFAELHLADYFKVEGGAFPYDTGRYRILSMGPEVTYSEDAFAISLQGRFLASSTQAANFDYLGNLLGPGVAQGSIGISGKVFF